MRLHVRDRIYGIETEFAAMVRKKNGTFIPPDGISLVTYYRYLEHYPDGLYLKTSKGHLWHRNGSLVYMDFNEHPEYATAECRSIKDVVAGFKAGELIMAEMFAAPLPESSNEDTFILFKNNISWNIAGDVFSTYGCHENYSLNVHVQYDDAFAWSLAPFLVTRQILDGTGTWNKNGTFVLSQRAKHIEKVRSEMATTNRSIVHVKTATDTGNRLHLVLGDSNILETAAFLKIGTTALVLTLIEGGHGLTLFCDYPLQALYDIAESANPNGKFFYTLSGESMSALEVQYTYLNQAKRHLPDARYDSEKTRNECMMILGLWEQALEAIGNNDKAWMLGRLDWATKRHFFESAIAQIPWQSRSQMFKFCRSIDILYHNISNKILQKRMNAHWGSRRIFSDEEIKQAKEFAPTGTRATLRAKFVAKGLEARDSRNWHIEWDRCVFKRSTLPGFGYLLTDPFVSESKEFDEFLTKLDI